MTNIRKYCIAIVILAIHLGCSSNITVLNTYNPKDIGLIKDKNIVVIARADNRNIRIAFEEEMSKLLTKKGYMVTESFHELPKLDPDKKLSKEEIQDFKKLIQNQGFNAVVITVLKDYKITTNTYEVGPAYTGVGESYAPAYYSGFYGYYSHPYSYSTIGTYVPASTETYSSITYVLETLVYNLDAPENAQLVSAVTTKMEDPNEKKWNATAAAYARTIIRKFI